MENINKLSKFLISAKINTYASVGESEEKEFTDGGKGFEFIEGEFKYKDRYFGSKAFIGEEIVSQNEKPIWGMNYYGGIVSENVPFDKVYIFLKKALSKAKEKKPFRGPDNFEEDNFKYINESEGSVDNFEGEETILYKDKKVYKLKYHGGLIKK